MLDQPSNDRAEIIAVTSQDTDDEDGINLCQRKTN